MDYEPILNDKFPGDWKDPLDLFGSLTYDLKSSGHDLELERTNIKDLVDKHGAQWVWDNRFRLVSMVKFFKELPVEVS